MLRIVEGKGYFLAPAFGAAAFAPFCFFVFAVFLGLLSPIVVLLFPANITADAISSRKWGGRHKVAAQEFLVRAGEFRVFRQRESLDNSGMTACRRRTLRIAFGVIAGLIAGAATAATIILLGASVFWLYLFGDDPWPSAAEVALVATAYGAGAIVFLAIVVLQARARS